MEAQKGNTRHSGARSLVFHAPRALVFAAVFFYVSIFPLIRRFLGLYVVGSLRCLRSRSLSKYSSILTVVVCTKTKTEETRRIGSSIVLATQMCQ